MNREVIWRVKRAENTVLAQHTMDTQKNSVKLQRWPLLLVPYLPFVYEIHIFGSKWHLTFTTQMYNSLWAFHAVHTWLQMHHMFKTMYICNTAGMASHRTMASEPSTYHDLLHPLHWALHVTQAQTSYINASMHVWFLPHKIMVIRCHMTRAANQMPHCDPNYHEHLRINAYMHINVREWRRVPTSQV